MSLRVLDEVIDMGAHGVGLLCLEGEPREGMRIRDARGQVHTVGRVTQTDGLYLLHIPEGTEAYFGRLLRDVRIDATLFEEADACL